MPWGVHCETAEGQVAMQSLHAACHCSCACSQWLTEDWLNIHHPSHRFHISHALLPNPSVRVKGIRCMAKTSYNKTHETRTKTTQIQSNLFSQYRQKHCLTQMKWILTGMHTAANQATHNPIYQQVCKGHRDAMIHSAHELIHSQYFEVWMEANSDCWRPPSSFPSHKTWKNCKFNILFFCKV